MSVFKPVQEKKFFSLGKKEGVMFPKAKQLSSKALVDLVTTRTRDSLRAWKLSGGYWAPGGCMPGPEKGCGRARGLVTIRRESQRKGGWSITATEKGEVGERRAREERHGAVTKHETGLLDSTGKQSTRTAARCGPLSRLKILFGLLSAWWNQEVALGFAHIHLFKNIISFSGRGSRWGLRLEAVRSDTEGPWEPWAVLPKASETEPDKMKNQQGN